MKLPELSFFKFSQKKKKKNPEAYHVFCVEGYIDVATGDRNGIPDEDKGSI